MCVLGQCERDVHTGYNVPRFWQRPAALPIEHVQKIHGQPTILLMISAFVREA